MSVNQLLDRFKGVHQQAVGVTSYVLLQIETKLKVNQGKVVEEFPYFVFRYVAKKHHQKDKTCLMYGIPSLLTHCYTLILLWGNNII